ncbi:MAG TPA: diaminopimelate decarboxylase [Clostridiales bacterium]|nr:diaminopimelate decarboxylase [Clostridiales bacterium]
MISKCLSVNEQGNLTIGGADTVQLARKYGTPLIVYDEETIRNNCRMFRTSIEKHCSSGGLALYASKAFSCREIYRIINQEGLGADVVSGGELYTALSAGFPAEKIFFHGNNKTEAELQFALKNNVGRIVVDNLEELKLLNNIAKELVRTAKILLRIKPGIDAHTHEFIKTGQIDSKFGFALETGEAFTAVNTAAGFSNLELTGLHCHIGSQIFDIEPFCLAAKVMTSFIAEIKQKLGLVISELNLGGGYGIKYLGSDNPKEYPEFIECVAKTVEASCGELSIDVPKLFFEPGRSIVGPAAITLYTAGSVKTIPGIRTYVSVDGGMTDNPRYALYKSPYEIVVANKADKPRDFVATIAGKCCESGDLLQENAPIQNPEPGDIIAVLATGAYNYSMASNYNRIPRPAVVMVNCGEDRLIIKRETYEDLVRNDI